MADMPTLSRDTLRSFLNELADAAGLIARRYFRETLTVDRKLDHSPVTIADRSIEDELRRRIAERFPDHGIFGEEYGAADLESAYVWVIDPIDGTKAFVSGNPLFGTLIGLLNRGQPVAGLIDCPFTRERWCGIGGLTLDAAGKACRTRPTSDLSDAILYTTSPESFTAAGKAAFAALSTKADMTRYGGDCYSYALLAAGHVDAVVEEGLQPYDHLPLVAVIEGAGGVVTDWHGQPMSLLSGGRVVATANPTLHARLLEELRPCA